MIHAGRRTNSVLTHTRDVWVLLAVFTACSNPPAPPADSRVPDVVIDDAARDTSSESPPDAPALACASDRECSARAQVCNTSLGRCVDCNAAADCPSGQLCASNRCFAPTACTTSRMCPGRVCSARLGYCVDCDADVDCPGGSVCRMNVCAPQAGACRASRDCSGATPICDTAQNRCVGCLTAADCPAGSGCRMSACAPRVCVPDSVRCPEGGRERTVCAADGFSTRTEPCPEGANTANVRCVLGNACAFDCRPGFADCDRMEANGCEVDVTVSARHCGACGNACPAGQGCAMGECRAGVPTAGYSFAEAPSLTFVDACATPGAVRYLADADDDVAQVPLPFAFRYWSTDFAAGAMISLTPNGAIVMNTAPDAGRRTPLGSPELPNAVIGPYYRDNYNRNPQCVVTVGTAPTRRWVNQWNDARNCCSVPGMTDIHLTFEVILHEGSHLIDFVYQRIENGVPGYVGLEDESGARAVSPFMGMGTPMTGRHYRFTPIP